MRDPSPRAEAAITIAFLLALTATLGALFIGEVLGQMPCTLCWYQRIAMFPLTVILAVALWRGDVGARAYALPLVIIGLLIALWHSGVYMGLRRSWTIWDRRPRTCSRSSSRSIPNGTGKAG